MHKCNENLPSPYCSRNDCRTDQARETVRCTAIRAANLTLWDAILCLSPLLLLLPSHSHAIMPAVNLCAICLTCIPRAPATVNSFFICIIYLTLQNTMKSQSRPCCCAAPALYLSLGTPSQSKNHEKCTKPLLYQTICSLTSIPFIIGLLKMQANSLPQILFINQGVPELHPREATNIHPWSWNIKQRSEYSAYHIMPT